MKIVLAIVALFLLSGIAAAVPTITAPTCVTQPCQLPGGTVGSFFTFTFTASGGTSPYTWAFSAGTFAACGLSLNSTSGVLSGSGIAGQCTATVQVTDTIPSSATVQATITVLSPTALHDGYVYTYHTVGGSYYSPPTGGIGSGCGGICLLLPPTQGIVVADGVDGNTTVAGPADLNNAAGFNIANDANVVHTSGTENIGGLKTFLNDTTFNGNTHFLGTLNMDAAGPFLWSFKKQTGTPTISASYDAGAYLDSANIFRCLLQAGGSCGLGMNPVFSNTVPCSSLNALSLVADTGCAAIFNSFILQSIGSTDNTKRHTLNAYLETDLHQTTANNEFYSLASNTSCILDVGSTGAGSQRCVGFEPIAIASDPTNSGVQLANLNSVKARIYLNSNAHVLNAVEYLGYLPFISSGAVLTNLFGFFFDAPGGSGTVTNSIGPVADSPWQVGAGFGGTIAALVANDTVAKGPICHSTSPTNIPVTLHDCWFGGTGSPNGVVTANVGSIFARQDGGVGTSLYVKETGSGNTGWAPLGRTSTNTDCEINSSSPGACGDAASGAFVVPGGASIYTVNTTAVTPHAHIFIQPRTDNTGLPSSPSCTAPANTILPLITSRTNGVSFGISFSAAGTNTCFDYWIVSNP